MSSPSNRHDQIARRRVDDADGGQAERPLWQLAHDEGQPYVRSTAHARGWNQIASAAENSISGRSSISRPV
jgi:hypothetical protein